MRLFSTTLLFLMLLSLFTVSSYADKDYTLDWYKDELDKKKQKALFAARKVNKWDDAMDKLESQYTANEAAIRRGSTMTVASAFGVGVTAFASGGSGVAWASIISAVTNAGMTQAERYAALYGFGGQSLLSGYESAISSKISALSTLEGYIAEYNVAYTAYSQVFDSHDVWDRHEGSGSPSSIHNKDDWISDWEYDDSLPSFRCGGSCGQSFSLPTSPHWIQCGYRNSVLEHPEYIKKTAEGFYPGKVIKDILKDRPAAEGCGRHYFNCKDEAEHQLRTCTRPRKRWEGSSIVTKACGDGYRRCMGQERDHNIFDSNPFKGPCSDFAGSSSSSANSKSGSILGSSSASAGGSVTVDLTTSTPFSTVYWYIKSSGTSGLGSSVETDYGGSSSYTASMTYTFGSADSGDYVITAYIYNYSDSSTYEVTHTVNVSGSSSTVSDDTPNCSDCTSHCSSPCSCTNSGTCGGTVTDNTPDCSYCTDGCSSCPSSDPPPSTPSTPPSTPSTPTTVACGGASYTGCSGASSRTEHHVPSCSNCGSSYWTCSQYAYRHTEVKTCKRSGCGASLTRCQNGPGLCTNGRNHWL